MNCDDGRKLRTCRFRLVSQPKYLPSLIPEAKQAGEITRRRNGAYNDCLVYVSVGVILGVDSAEKSITGLAPGLSIVWPFGVFLFLFLFDVVLCG